MQIWKTLPLLGAWRSCWPSQQPEPDLTCGACALGLAGGFLSPAWRQSIRDQATKRGLRLCLSC